MSLDELEAAFRARMSIQGEPVVLIAMQIPERDVRTLRPRLQSAGVSLSELVRHLLASEASNVTAQDAYNARHDDGPTKLRALEMAAVGR